jgi:nucleotide-binding universal stress UspA family protein
MDAYDALKPVVCKGNAPEEIISHARTQHIDLIVLGANHKPFMENTVMGKTTELVLRQAPVPVLAVPHVIN